MPDEHTRTGAGSGAGRTVLVTGATGRQGGATAARLLDDGWRVRAVVRDPASPAARDLAAAGAEPHRGDLDDLEGLKMENHTPSPACRSAASLRTASYATSFPRTPPCNWSP